MSGEDPKPIGKPYVKGQSGNPLGRPARADAFRERMEKLGAKAEDFAEKTLDAALKLEASNLDESAAALRNTAVKVSQVVLDHAYGKPTQALQHTGKDGESLGVSDAAALLLAHLTKLAPKAAFQLMDATACTWRCPAGHVSTSWTGEGASVVGERRPLCPESCPICGVRS